MGSPPRMRGAAIDVPKASIAPRIIPARAGSSSNRSMTIGTSRDHPRVCGGAGQVQGLRHELPGIIPARAGSSAWSRVLALKYRDHPRVCGEQPGMRDRRDGFLESSPRVQGAGCEYTIDKDGNGIIPACAGSRRCVQAITSEWRDHPRACGEQSSALAPDSAWTGSSPRMRGAVI